MTNKAANNERLLLAVKESKEYSRICDETVLRIISAAAPKYKSDKEALKSVKATLREISAAFLTEGNLRKARGILLSINWENQQDILDKTGHILSLHQSSRERLPHFSHMIEDVWRETSFRSVLDIGCGLCPFFIPHMTVLKGVNYYAMDIHRGAVDLVNMFFDCLSISGCAVAGDILIGTPETQADCAFLFKLLPFIERVEKGGSKRIIGGLNCDYIAATFPTRSLSGKNVGMKNTYSALVRDVLSAFPVVYEKEYANEILFILQKSP